MVQRQKNLPLWEDGRGKDLEAGGNLTSGSSVFGSAGCLGWGCRGEPFPATPRPGQAREEFRWGCCTAHVLLGPFPAQGP